MNKIFDWIVVGGGIAGITTAEILTREGHSVLLLEKNNQLASETSKVFHEWLHTGSLYSLIPDRLLTTRFVLGAIDDLLGYYQSFRNMNLVPTETGLQVTNGGWFNGANIEFHYKVRKLNPIWMATVSRSINIVEMIREHDWLRRRAGSLHSGSNINKRLVNKIPLMLRQNNSFLKVQSPDITINSRVLIADILNQAEVSGLQIKTNSEVVSIANETGMVNVKTLDKSYSCKNVVVCAPDVVSKLFDKKIKTTYAPIAVVDGVDENTKSFVELDYHVKNCINLLVKGSGVGQAGGISVSKQSEIKPYMQYVMKEHKKKNPSIEMVDQYVGLKKELVSAGQERNYLYHIEEQDGNVWSLVLGKFTLAFSAAPEFYRRVYHKNPKRRFEEVTDSVRNTNVSETSWKEIIDNKGKE